MTLWSADCAGANQATSTGKEFKGWSKDLRQKTNFTPISPHNIHIYIQYHAHFTSENLEVQDAGAPGKNFVGGDKYLLK